MLAHIVKGMIRHYIALVSNLVTLTIVYWYWQRFVMLGNKFIPAGMSHHKKCLFFVALTFIHRRIFKWLLFNACLMTDDHRFEQFTKYIWFFSLWEKFFLHPLIMKLLTEWKIVWQVILLPDIAWLNFISRCICHLSMIVMAIIVRQWIHR